MVNSEKLRPGGESRRWMRRRIEIDSDTAEAFYEVSVTWQASQARMTLPAYVAALLLLAEYVPRLSYETVHIL